MRFDLELNMVSKLTQEGLDNLSESLYGTSDIIPAFWDEGTSIDRTQLNKGSVNVSNYSNRNRIDNSYFSSGVDLYTDDLKFVENIIYGSTVVPVFNSGKYSVNRSKYMWSKNNIVKPCKLENGRYVCNVDSGVDYSNILVYTVNFANPGYTKVKKNFIFTPWDQKYFESQNENALENTLKYVFKKSKADYKFTVYNNKVYLSVGKISYSEVTIGTFQDTANKMFALPEYPVENLQISGYPSSGYTLRSSIVLFNKDTQVNIGTEVKASFDVIPFVSYIESRDGVSDYVFFNSNMNPKVMNYKNGTLCLSNNLGDANIPVDLKVSSNKRSIFGPETFRVTAGLNGIGSISIPNKEVTLNVTSDNAVFVDNNSNTITKTTMADGTVQCDVVAKTDNIGYYIQSNWASGNTINVPFKLNSFDPSNTYLYFITSDDPILGKKSPSIYDSQFVESYSSDEISSYVMNGRKIAYVSLQDNNGKLTSKFVKPKTITALNTATATFKDVSSMKASMDAKGIISTFVSNDSDGVAIYSYTATGVTQITYENTIPVVGNIAGYWLITDGSIDVNASYEDDEITLKSNNLSIDVQNIKSESAFVINRENASLGASQLGAFGYLTISEYLKNPFGLTSFSVYCTHSDCIYKKCIHPNPEIRKNFILDEGKVGCIHNKEWDEANWVCPGQNAHLVNPFIMHLEEI